jgi:hypothetical protein
MQLALVSRWCLLALLSGGLSAPARALADDKKEPDKKEEKKEDKKAPPAAPGLDPFGGLPDFDELFKGLPLDPAQTKELKAQLERAREMWKKAMEKGGGFPGGALPGFPGLPPGALPPGALPPGFPMPGAVPGFPGFPAFPGKTEGRLGIQVEAPSKTLIEHLDLKDDRGLVIVNVTPDSAAAKAGLKIHDIILEWAGKPVTHDAAAFKESVDKAGKEPVEVKVLRKGKTETIKGLIVPERKAAPPAPRPPLDVRAPRLEVLFSA